MVDEYPQKVWHPHPTEYVQIPLWSMNTMILSETITELFSSDSSMVDEYAPRNWTTTVMSYVQIPLWSMNTYKR